VKGRFRLFSYGQIAASLCGRGAQFNMHSAPHAFGSASVTPGGSRRMWTIGSKPINLPCNQPEREYDLAH
jgi:hypothetical protein